MADELKPCPFCGGAASIVYSSGNEVYNKQWSVGCTLCSVQFSAIGSNSWRSVKEEDDAAQAKAIAAWNRRALSHAAGQDGEQCRAASVEPDAWLYEYEHDGESDHCLSRVRFLRSWVEAKRATEHPLYLRALSRGVPEGNNNG